MLFSIFLLFCLLVTYPLALVAPGGLGGTSLRFIVTVPTLFAVSLAALLGTLLTPRANCEVRILRAGQGLLLVILAWGVVTSVLNPGSSSEALFLRVGLFSIPLFVALADRPDPGTVVSVLAIAWGFNTLYAVLDIAGSQQAVGLAGNRNWMASATIALLPWAWLAIRHLLEPAVPCGKTRRASTAEDCRLPLTGGNPPSPVHVFLTIVLALVVAWFGHSRAVWLVLGAYLLFHVLLHRFGTIARILLATALAAVALTAILRSSQIRENIVGRDDIRPELWKQTVALIVDHPVAGVGPGRFRAVFPDYRSDEQMRSNKAGSVNDHPHNEILNIAAELGILPALALCVLLLPLAARAPDSATGRAAHFTAFMIVGHAMLDKTLVQQPTALAGLVCLGVCWRPILARWSGTQARKPETEESAATQRIRRVRGIAAAALLLITLLLGIREFRGTMHLRTGLLAEHEGRFGSAYKAYARAAEINPADIRGHAYAGTTAMRNLHRPRIALPHLVKVVDLEPAYGHVNRWIGMALGVMGRHTDAAPFFRKDARLFPFFEPSWFNYYQNAAFRNDTKDLKEARAGLKRARLETVRRRLGEKELNKAVETLKTAVAGQDANTALIMMYKLTDGIRRAGPTANAKGEKKDQGARFTAEDVQRLFNGTKSPPQTLRMQALLDVLSKGARASAP
jgi:O-antigen ligase